MLSAKLVAARQIQVTRMNWMWYSLLGESFRQCQGLPEGLGRVYKPHSSSVLHGSSVDLAVGLEVEAAMGDFMYDLVCHCLF